MASSIPGMPATESVRAGGRVERGSEWVGRGEAGDRRVTWGRQAGDRLGDRDRSQGGHIMVRGRRWEGLLAALKGAVEAVLPGRAALAIIAVSQGHTHALPQTERSVFVPISWLMCHL